MLPRPRPLLPRPEVSPSLLLLQEAWSCSDDRLHCESCTRLAKTYALFAFLVNTFGNFLHCLSLPRYCPAMVIASERRRFAVLDPADESVLETIASATPEDGLAAVGAAAAAAADWAARAPRERAETLRRAYDEMIPRLDEIARIIVREMGKPLAEARGEATYAAEFLRWFSEEAVRADGAFATAPAGTNRMLVSHAPIGI